MSGPGDLRVAIVGGGIAGLTLSIALRRAGVRHQIYEQAREIRAVGAGLQLAPNSTRLLHRLGLEEPLRARATQPEFIERRRWRDGSVLNHTPLGDELRRVFGAPYYLVHRADLQQALLARIDPGVLNLHAVCVGVDDDGDRVRLSFADGGTATAEVVVGADGIHSAVRASIMDDRPRFVGRTVYRGLVPVDRLPYLRGDRRITMWMGPRLHCIYYTVCAGELVNFSASTPAGDWQTESWLAEGKIEDLVEAYAGWHDEVLTVVTAADQVNRWALYERPGCYRQGRRALVGDAAHASLPFLAQGANQAIEDVTTLAVLLAKADRSTVDAALDAYEQCRRERIAAVQAESRRRAELIHLPDGEQQRRRDLGLDNTHDLRNAEWLYGYDAEEAARQA